MIEVEYKYAVESIESIEAALVELGATAVKQIEQKDDYFNHQHDNFKERDIAFRIRQADDQYELTYKGPNLDPVGKIREEIELPLANANDTDKLRRILAGVGFDEVSSVSKTRRTLHVRWQETAVEACLDQVHGLGDFIELELVVDDTSKVEHAKAVIEGLAIELGVSQPIRTSYLDLLMQRDLE